MKLEDIAKSRNISQNITQHENATVKELVSWMGAIQAQDFAMAKWAIGLRLANSTEQQIEEAYNNGDIIRTHLMRPTWHFVPAQDLNWLLALTAPQILKIVSYRDKDLELNVSIYKKCNKIIEKTLLAHTYATRDLIGQELLNSKIDIENNRLSHILIRAELEGLICSGPLVGKKLTYALLESRVSEKKRFNRDESLAELAKRFILSHAPVTIKDFTWWSGLSVSDSKKAFDFVKDQFISEKIGSETYWLTSNSRSKISKTKSVFLLPAYDEFLIGYANREASISLSNNKNAISNNGIFRPTIMVNGKVIGIWKRQIVKNKIIVETNFFESPELNSKLSFEDSLRKYAAFSGMEVLLAK